MANGQPKKVFISYSWDDDAHKKWVRDFAVRLRDDGVDVILDQWHTGLGDQLSQFMEKAVRESDFVLCVCTPRYKHKSDSREGGVGYEGYIMTVEFYRNREQRKFIPVLRSGEWDDAAPSWLSGIIYADLCGNPYSERNYRELLSMLQGKLQYDPFGGENFDFVNREIELGTLDPAKLRNSYWQCALVSAPAGYGKSRLLKRLTEKVGEAAQHWNWIYIDLAERPHSSSVIPHIWGKIFRKEFPDGLSVENARQQVCAHILDNSCRDPKDGSFCGILLMVDAVDDLAPADAEWLFSVLNHVVTGSYISYDRGTVSFPVRFVFAGRKVQEFWSEYRRWENSSGCRYHLRSEKLLTLSPFEHTHVEELIDRKATKKHFETSQLDIADIAKTLLYLSGGHPKVINGILDELIEIGFRQIDSHFENDNIRNLVERYIHNLVQTALEKYDPLSQKNIRTILVFRMVTLDILDQLRVNSLISWTEDNAKLLSFLRDSQFLRFDDKALCYRDDILRRIIYLDFAFGCVENAAHIQAVHRCALAYYTALIERGEPKSAYFIEWLFHALQTDDMSRERIISEWNSLVENIHSSSFLAEDLRKAVMEALPKDSEIRYMYGKCFGSEDFSLLFQNDKEKAR
jgi:hypothetical protein